MRCILATHCLCFSNAQILLTNFCRHISTTIPKTIPTFPVANLALVSKRMTFCMSLISEILTGGRHAEMVKKTKPWPASFLPVHFWPKERPWNIPSPKMPTVPGDQGAWVVRVSTTVTEATVASAVPNPVSSALKRVDAVRKIANDRPLAEAKRKLMRMKSWLTRRSPCITREMNVKDRLCLLGLLISADTN